MKIAVITNDFKTISAHFGRARYYDVFTIENNQVMEKETRPKANHNQYVKEPHPEPSPRSGQGHGTDPASQHRHTAMIEPITDCQVVIARGLGMGAHQSLAAGGIPPLLQIWIISKKR